MEGHGDIIFVGNIDVCKRCHSFSYNLEENNSECNRLQVTFLWIGGKEVKWKWDFLLSEIPERNRNSAAHILVRLRDWTGLHQGQ